MLAIRTRHSASVAAAVAVAASMALLACAERRPNSEASPSQLGGAAPPASSAGPAHGAAQSAANSAAPALAPASSVPGAASATIAARPATPPSASASASAPSAAQPSAAPSSALAEPTLLDSDGKPLPQTEERPSVDSAAFKHRVELLAQAIIRDDPSLARSVFFPVVAYEQVKAIAKPARDWQHRLMRSFEADIHQYHRALGRNPEQAQLAGIDVPEPSARWMKPGSEGNRLGYFRVLRARLRLSKADGKTQTFEVTSMISWRGEWYVVHLNGFD